MEMSHLAVPSSSLEFSPLGSCMRYTNDGFRALYCSVFGGLSACDGKRVNTGLDAEARFDYLAPERPIPTYMPAILVEGWRFLPQSYALVNEYQCLEILRRGDIALYHRDKPFPPQWTTQRGLLAPEQEQRITALCAPPDGIELDAVLRIFNPFDFSPSRARHTYVFITCETGAVSTWAIRGDTTLRRALADSDVTLITPSRWSAEGLIHDGADGKRIRIVPHGVDVALNRPLSPERRVAVRQRLGWKGEFVFLNIGGLSGNKGIPQLLRAFAVVARKHPRSRLVLKGLNALYESQEMLRSALAELASHERTVLQQRLTYLGGSMTQREMVELYQAADVYVSPYRGEGFNLPVLEAIACGLPVICTAGGSTDDFTTPATAMRVESRLHKLVTEQGQERYFLEPDPGHLVELMSRVIEQDDWRRAVRIAGPAHVRGHYTWEQAVDALLNVLLAPRATASSAV